MNDLNYCRYHKMLGDPTKNCYVFKDMLHTLVDVKVLKLFPEQKTIMTDMTSSIPFG